MEELTRTNFSFKKLFVPLTTFKAIHWIVVIGIIVYSNSLFNNFVGDDISQIINNIKIHSIANIGTFFTGSSFYNVESQNLSSIYYRPLVLTFYSLVYTVFGPNYFIYHLLQVFFYIANTVILFLFLKHFLKRSHAFVLSLIFLVHPINSEVAFYIADLQDVLFFFFGIISLWILQKYHSQKAYLVAALCLFFSLLFKEAGILFLFISLIYVFIYERKSFYQFLGYSFVFFSSYLILRFNAIGFFINPTSSPIAAIPFIERIYNMPTIFFFYLKTFFFPRDISVSYMWVYNHIDFIHFYLPLIINVLFLIFIFFFAVKFYKKYHRRYFTFYLFFMIWFLSGILFHLQFFPLDQTVADRWFYFPIVGLIGMIGVGMDAYNVNLKNKWVIFIFTTILLLLSFRTFIRSFDWRDDITLATQDIKVSKDAFNLYSQLSGVYIEKGDYEKGKMYAEKSISIFPDIAPLLLQKLKIPPSANI